MFADTVDIRLKISVHTAVPHSALSEFFFIFYFFIYVHSVMTVQRNLVETSPSNQLEKRVWQIYSRDVCRFEL